MARLRAKVQAGFVGYTQILLRTVSKALGPRASGGINEAIEKPRLLRLSNTFALLPYLQRILELQVSNKYPDKVGLFC